MEGKSGDVNRKEEEIQESEQKEKHQFVLKRLMLDIRYYAHVMQEFVDLPPDGQHPKGWEGSIADMLKDTSTQITKDGSDDLNIEPIITLLNYRDKILTSIVTGVLYTQALLYEDHGDPVRASTTQGNASVQKTQSSRKLVDGQQPDVMQQLAEYIRSVRAKVGSMFVPDKYVLPQIPSASEVGWFTYQAGSGSGNQNQTEDEEMSVFQSRVATLIRQMTSLDRTLRRIKFGAKVTVAPGKTWSTDEMRVKITDVFNKCSRLEHELQMSKAQQHAAFDVQIELNKKRIEDCEKESHRKMQRILRLQGDVECLKIEIAAIKKEKAEVLEKQQEMANEHLPVLSIVEHDLSTLKGRIEHLYADAEMLSQMFKLQVKETQKTTEERDAIAKELASLNSTLRREKLKNQLKDIELGKKETLHQKTKEARQSTLENYVEGKILIQRTETQMEQKRKQHEEMRAEIERRDEIIKGYLEDMRVVTMDLDELEQEKKECMKEFKAAVGRPYAMLLEQYKSKSKTEHSSE